MVSGRFLPRLPACRCANRPNSTNLVLVGSRVRPNFPNRRRKASCTRRASAILETDHKVIDVAHQSGFAPQPTLDHPLEPKVENVMKVQVAQQHTDRSSLWGSLFARMDFAIFQNARLQPTPDQIDQARISDSMFNKPKHPFVIETPEEILQIRLQHPSDFAASDDLIEGRQSMMSAQPWPAAERAG